MLSNTNRGAYALVIAGSSSDSGAGIQMDLKTFHSFGIYATSVITCLTAQNTTGVKNVELTKIFEEQLLAVLSDIEISVVKFGVVPDKEYFKIFKKHCNYLKYVLDPVMVAEADSFSFVKEKEALIEMAKNKNCLISTPNLIEAERLSGIKINDLSSGIEAVNKLKRLGLKSFIIKGVKYSENQICDIFFNQNLDEPRLFIKKKLPYKFHGSGCCFASVMAANYYISNSLYNSVVLAEDYIEKVLNRAEKIGKGEVLVAIP